MKFYIARVIYSVKYEVINCYYMKSAVRLDSSNVNEYGLELSIVW